MKLRAWPPAHATLAEVVADLGPLRDALSGAGPALCPPGSGDEPPASVPSAPDDLALVVGTSGSTGSPKRALLSAAALRASGEATAQALGGHGTWVLALGASHIAGLQVLARSVLAGTDPVALPDGPFTAAAFAAATDRAGSGHRLYTSVVPTQLVRLLDSPVGRAAGARYDAILVGGAALRPDLRARALREGLRVVQTYGMTETAGGCVYDGIPLPDMEIELDEHGRVSLGGPCVAHGYLGLPQLSDEAFRVDGAGRRWFRTSDLGSIEADGRLRILGRADDLINTGGYKVAPSVVEEAITAAWPAVRDVVVVGVPDPEWGEAVAAAVVLQQPTEGATAVATTAVDPTAEGATDLAELRELLREALPPHALPQRLLVLDELPLRGPGKPDRAALARRFG